MALASLGVGAPGWRAARAASVVAALLRGDLPADDALDGLADLGEPAEGWWTVIGRARRAGSLGLLLPRPGDPRGISLPRGVITSGAVGWDTEDGSSWLLAVDGGAWHAIDLPGQSRPPRDLEEADRHLRVAVVQVAHLVDGLEVVGAGVPRTPASGSGAAPGSAMTARERQECERTVDAWLLGSPALSARGRAVAAVGLRMLLAIDGIRALADSAPLEAAARQAVEAAFTSGPASR